MLPAKGRGSPVLDNLVAGWPVSITFGERVVETETNSTHTLTFSSSWTITNLILEVTYAEGTTSVSDTERNVPLRIGDFNCDPAIVGKYQVKWDDLCTTLYLDLVQDFCVPRRFKYSGLVLKRVGNSECPNRLMNTQREQIYNAKYFNFNPANELSGLDVCFVVRPGTSARDVLEQSFRGTRRSNWRFDDHHLFVYDVSSRPKFLSCDDYPNAGIYMVTWYNCERFVLTLVSDSCRGRREVYGDMDVNFGKVEISPSYNASPVVLPSFLLVALAAVLALF